MSKCCIDMENYIKHNCDIHEDIFDCPDTLIFYDKKFDEYGIIIHDGSKSYIVINHCPWCGKELPTSKRDLWFEELEKLGIDNPFEDTIPNKFNSDEWWKEIKK